MKSSKTRVEKKEKNVNAEKSKEENARQYVNLEKILEQKEKVHIKKGTGQFSTFLGWF